MQNKELKKIYFIISIISIVISLMFLVYSIYFLMNIIKLQNTPEEDYGPYFIVYFLSFIIRNVFVFVLFIFLILNMLLSVLYALSGVKLLISLKKNKDYNLKRNLKMPFIVSVIISVFSGIEFILGICRLFVHGYQNNLFRFLFLGFFPFVLMSIFIILDKIAIRKQQKIQVLNETGENK